MKNVVVRRLSGHSSARDLVNALESALADGESAVELDLSATRDAYPNGLTPAAAIVGLYRAKGLDISASSESPFMKKSRFLDPIEANEENVRTYGDYQWNRVFSYSNSRQAYLLTSSVMKSLEERIEFGKGVLNSVNWALYEVLDNVLEHSRSPRGFFCMQYLVQTKRLTLCVADAGIGIHRSFAEGTGGHRPQTAQEALELAIRRQTSSTGDKRGNGLYGLSEIVRRNGGRLELRSGRAILDMAFEQQASAAPPGHSLVIDGDHHCTVVDMQLAVDRPVQLQDIFAREYDARIEAAEDEEAGGYKIELVEFADTIATREGGRQLRTRTLNLMTDGATPMTIDFTGISVASASFIDEYVGKLAETLGSEAFRKQVRIQGLTDENSHQVQSVLERRIGSRNS